MNNMNDKISNFCIIHLHLQWEDGKTSLAYEDCKMKDNYERDESAPSLPVSEPKINAEEGDTANYDKGYFGSDPKEEHRSNLISSYKLPNEVEDKPPLARHELGNMKMKIMMQMDEQSSLSCNIVKFQPHQRRFLPSVRNISRGFHLSILVT